MAGRRSTHRRDSVSSNSSDEPPAHTTAYLSHFFADELHVLRAHASLSIQIQSRKPEARLRACSSSDSECALKMALLGRQPRALVYALMDVAKVARGNSERVAEVVCACVHSCATDVRVPVIEALRESTAILQPRGTRSRATLDQAAILRGLAAAMPASTHGATSAQGSARVSALTSVQFHAFADAAPHLTLEGWDAAVAWFKAGGITVPLDVHIAFVRGLLSRASIRDAVAYLSRAEGVHGGTSGQRAPRAPREALVDASAEAPSGDVPETVSAPRRRETVVGVSPAEAAIIAQAGEYVCTNEMPLLVAAAMRSGRLDGLRKLLKMHPSARPAAIQEFITQRDMRSAARLARDFGVRAEDFPELAHYMVRSAISSLLRMAARDLVLGTVLDNAFAMSVFQEYVTERVREGRTSPAAGEAILKLVSTPEPWTEERLAMFDAAAEDLYSIGRSTSSAAQPAPPLPAMPRRGEAACLTRLPDPSVPSRSKYAGVDTEPAYVLRDAAGALRMPEYAHAGVVDSMDSVRAVVYAIARTDSNTGTRLLGLDCEWVSAAVPRLHTGAPTDGVEPAMHVAIMTVACGDTVWLFDMPALHAAVRASSASQALLNHLLTDLFAPPPPAPPTVVLVYGGTTDFSVLHKSFPYLTCFSKVHVVHPATALRGFADASAMLTTSLRSPAADRPQPAAPWHDPAARGDGATFMLDLMAMAKHRMVPRPDAATSKLAPTAPALMAGSDTPNLFGSVETPLEVATPLDGLEAGETPAAVAQADEADADAEDGAAPIEAVPPITDAGADSMKTHNVGGLSALVQSLLGAPLNKYWQMSNWERRPLFPGQIEYAAMDAWVLPRCFHVLAGLPERDDAALPATTASSKKKRRA